MDNKTIYLFKNFVLNFTSLFVGLYIVAIGLFSFTGAQSMLYQLGVENIITDHSFAIFIIFTGLFLMNMRFSKESYHRNYKSAVLDVANESRFFRAWNKNDRSFSRGDTGDLLEELEEIKVRLKEQERQIKLRTIGKVKLEVALIKAINEDSLKSTSYSKDASTGDMIRLICANGTKINLNDRDAVDALDDDQNQYSIDKKDSNVIYAIKENNLTGKNFD